MQVVFMRQAQCWSDSPSLREPIFRFEPIRSRNAALQFLTGGPSDPLPTLVGMIGDDAILEEWLEAGAALGFQKLWECEGSGLGKWQRAKELKGIFEDAHAIRECISNPVGRASKKPRL